MPTTFFTERSNSWKIKKFTKFSVVPVKYPTLDRQTAGLEVSFIYVQSQTKGTL